MGTHYEAFLGSVIGATLWACALAIASRSLVHRICLVHPPTSFDRDIQHPAGLALLRHPIESLSLVHKYRNVGLFAISYAFRPRLRFRLTLGGLALPRKS